MFANTYTSGRFGIAFAMVGLLTAAGCGSSGTEPAPINTGGGVFLPDPDAATTSSSGTSSGGTDAATSSSSGGDAATSSGGTTSGADAGTSNGASSGGTSSGGTSSGGTSSGGEDAGTTSGASGSSSSGADAGTSSGTDAGSSGSTSGGTSGADASSSSGASSSGASSSGADASSSSGSGSSSGTGPVCEDKDGDGYGKNCAQGADCDDANPNFSVICPDCTKQNYEGCPCSGVAANCYSGEAVWLGKGVCQAGVQLCKEATDKKKYWGACNNEVLPNPEACDGKDNNCNGLIDEGVLSTCGTCDMSCTLQQVGPDQGNPFDTSSANGVSIDKNGYLFLDSKQSNVNLNHIWIAGTSAKVVSKLNTKTGMEVGRYHSCPSPSRTSVDLNGDVWVGCRSDGQVMKITNDPKFCVDKNGNGSIDTSTDINGNGKIESNEMKPYNQDECVRFIVKPDGGESVIRAAGVDKDNHAWVGGWNKKTLWRLNPNAGNVVDSINLGCNPYGLVIDQKGVIWVSGRGCSNLLRADPKTKSVKQVGNGKGSPYGINVDMFGRIWIANTNNYTSRYDPATNQWNPVQHSQRSRGVATSNDGNVYVALDTTSNIAIINAVTLTKIGEISLGSGRFPVGIAVDYDGYVWAVNQSKSSASKVNPGNKQIIGEYPVGSGPYTYSDMTGYTLNNYTAPKGNYTHIFGFSGWGGTVAESKTTTIWEMINIEATIPAKGQIKIRYRVGNTLKELKTKPWSKEVGPFPPAQFPVNLQAGGNKVEGRFLEVEIFMQAGDDKKSPLVKSLAAKGKQVALP